MRRPFALAILLALAIASAVALSQGGSTAELTTANTAWADGQYITALNGYVKLLNSPAGEQYLEPIALQTGELFVTDELTKDGRAPRLSPDGRFIAYETGPARTAVTRIQRNEGQYPLVADLSGTGAVFSRSGNKVAYLKTEANAELDKAQEALDKAPETGQERTNAQQAVNRLQMKSSRVILRDLSTQREVELKTGDLMKTTLAFGADEETVYFVGGKETERERNDIYMTRPTTVEAVSVTDAAGFKNAPVVSPTGKLMIISIPNQNPIPAPPAQTANQEEQGERGGQGGRGGQGQRGGQQGRGGQGGQGGQPAAPSKFGLVDLATRNVTVIEGSAPTFAQKDDTIAYVARAGQDNTIMLMAPAGAAVAILKTADRIDAPSFAPDGQRLVYQRMLLHDWEVQTLSNDGKEESRLTREIQHDVLPRFISDRRVMAMIGEARHRRAQIYDLGSNARVRVFHNNTVRTIAPEYSWIATPDGSKILISAERDGDTISVERGVYVVDLNRKISKSDLLKRLQDSIASETALRGNAQKIYQPLSDEVRRVTDQVSASRIYQYEKSLFDFDSKHITRPGNKPAADYLFNTYRSFGYEPEFQQFEARQSIQEGKTSNVIARLKGVENPELIYVISSHFDSSAAGPGAEDNTSGTAALLEAARVLAGRPMPATIVFASFTGEEAGLLGSREFVRVAAEQKWKVVGALNNDTIGWSNDGRLDNTIRFSNDSIRDIQHSAAMLFSKLITYDARYYKSTDAAAFFPAFGDVIGGIGSYPVLGSPHYHQSHDNLEFVNHQLIAETSKTTVATIMMLASSPSPVKDLKQTSYGNSARFTWTASPEKSVREYIVSWGPPQGARKQEKRSTPDITLAGAKPGDVVLVKAVNSRGMEGWDWAKTTVRGQ